MSVLTAHSGGDAGNFTVTDSGNDVILPAAPRRRYLLLVSDKDNVDTIFLFLNETGPAVFEAGIPLYPGNFHEIVVGHNLYKGPIRAVTDTGKTARVFFQEGK